MSNKRVLKKNKQDQTIKRALELIEIKYGRSRTEQIEECVDDILKFIEDNYEEDSKLILAMEIIQREMDSKLKKDEWFAS